MLCRMFLDLDQANNIQSPLILSLRISNYLSTAANTKAKTVDILIGHSG